ncbi:unnamed protein product, partial [Brassica oleracea var. botrytis]
KKITVYRDCVNKRKVTGACSYELAGKYKSVRNVSVKLNGLRHAFQTEQSGDQAELVDQVRGAE